MAFNSRRNSLLSSDLVAVWALETWDSIVMAPHPFTTLSVEETKVARDVILAQHPDAVVAFREIYLQEPEKELMKKYLEAERSAINGELPAVSVPRLAKCQYDIIGSDKIPAYHEAVVDINSKKRVKHETIGKQHQSALSLWEFEVLLEACKKNEEFQNAIKEFNLPEGFELVVEPWPYGGLDLGAENRRYFQGLCFAQDTRTGNPDSNFYAYPLPLIPVLDAHKREIVRLDRLATGGKGDSLTGKTHAEDVLAHCQPAEYVPELLPHGTRKDMKPIDITQPEGPSFAVTDESLVEWQKWRFRVSFNPREGAVLHDVCYDGRSVLYRMSMSEMTVPYADARPPFHRKQAFDFGDGGAGNCANNLSLGCDCLGVIKYFDGVVVNNQGEPRVHPNVICLHEQDNGIGWKVRNNPINPSQIPAYRLTLFSTPTGAPAAQSSPACASSSSNSLSPSQTTNTSSPTSSTLPAASRSKSAPRASSPSSTLTRARRRTTETSSPAASSRRIISTSSLLDLIPPSTATITPSCTRNHIPRPGTPRQIPTVTFTRCGKRLCIAPPALMRRRNITVSSKS